MAQLEKNNKVGRTKSRFSRSNHRIWKRSISEILRMADMDSTDPRSDDRQTDNATMKSSERKPGLETID